MEEDLALELSQEFWDKYKSFVKEKLPLKGLKKYLSIPNDVVFYQEHCDRGCNVTAEIETIMSKKLDIFLDELLSEIETATHEERKAIFHRVLQVFLGIYACITNETTKAKCNDITIYITSFVESVHPNEYLNQIIREMVSSMLSSLREVMDREIILKPIVFKIVCLYATLAVSDTEGRIKCNQLGKQLHKSAPESVTLSYLKKREKNSKLPICEIELLEKYSFWCSNS